MYKIFSRCFGVEYALELNLVDALQRILLLVNTTNTPLCEGTV